MRTKLETKSPRQGKISGVLSKVGRTAESLAFRLRNPSRRCRRNYMKTIFSASVLIFFLFALHSRSFAMISVGDVSPDQAKELGVTFRSHTNGEAGIQVWMEFKTEGELAKITYIQLQIGDRDNRIM